MDEKGETMTVLVSRTGSHLISIFLCHENEFSLLHKGNYEKCFLVLYPTPFISSLVWKCTHLQPFANFTPLQFGMTSQYFCLKKRRREKDDCDNQGFFSTLRTTSPLLIYITRTLGNTCQEPSPFASAVWQCPCCSTVFMPTYDIEAQPLETPDFSLLCNISNASNCCILNSHVLCACLICWHSLDKKNRA